jgi:hypothetical protein
VFNLSFNDPQLEKCYGSQFAEAAEPSDDLRQVLALIATHDLFQMLEGDHSPRVHETMEQLLLPGVRSGLRRWYQRTEAGTDPAAVEFRTRLSQLAKEQFGPVAETPRET